MNLASYIDHTILRAEATKEDVLKVCREALLHKFAAVCINPSFVKDASSVLKGSDVKVATVVGFPLGATTTADKGYETGNALKGGADEIDMVMAVGLFKGRDYKFVLNDIKYVVGAAEGRIVKVILETCYLTSDEIAKACEIAIDAGAGYVKTSTGFGLRGASIEDIKIMKRVVGDKIKIKASGGIKTREAALAMIEAGASRIGTSSGVNIIKCGG